MRAFLLFVLAFGVSARKDYTGHRLLSVKPSDVSQLEFLVSLEDSPVFDEPLDFWAGPSMRIQTEIHVSAQDYPKLTHALSEAGLSYSILNENLQEAVDDEASRQAKASKIDGGCDHLAKYCTYEEILAFLIDLESKHSSTISITSIGITSGGNDLLQVKVAQDLSVPKKAIFIEAGTHAREWISVSSGLEMISRLVDGSTDSTKMLDKFDWYIIPVHNPDGYEYTHTNDRYWRKNRQKSCNGAAVGIDLNRNWSANWGGAGSSGTCSSITYRGTYPFEAYENMALRDAVWAVNETANIHAFFSIHCFSQYMLIPYGFQVEKPTRYSELEAKAKIMMAALKTVDGSDFPIGTPAELFSVASGGAFDYFFLAGVPWSYTYELRPDDTVTTNAGFNLHPDFIPVATEEVFESLSAFANSFQNE